MRNEQNARRSLTGKPQRQRCGQGKNNVVKNSDKHFQVLNAFRDDRQTVAARMERERLARESGDTHAEVDNAEPPVDEMSNSKIKTLRDCS